MPKERSSARKLYTRDTENSSADLDGNQTINTALDNNAEGKTEQISEQLMRSLLERQVAELNNTLNNTLNEAKTNNNRLEQCIQDLENNLALANDKIKSYESEIEVFKAEKLKELNEENEKYLNQEQERLKKLTEESVSGLIHSFESSHKTLLTCAEQTILDIAFTATAQILGQIVTSQPETYKSFLLERIQSLTASLSTFNNLKIFLSTQEYNLITNRNRTANIQSGYKLVGGVPISCFVEDPSLSAGDCIVNSVHGELELRLEQQILLLKEALLGMAKKRALVQ